MCFSKLFKKKEELPADYPVYQIRWEDLKTVMDSYNLELMLKDQFKPDSYIYFTGRLDWDKLLPYLTYSAELYAEVERRDCDDYSKKASADAAWLFGLGCIQVWGDTPYGRHAFNLVITSPTTVKIFEPNAGFECAGELMDLENEYGWKADSWKP